jgi:membrane-bound lytic murein transglycosylase D
MSELSMLSPGLQSRLVLASLAALLCATTAAAETFPIPATLVPRVEFWKRVYTEVGTDGGLIHDTEHLGVVYEVIRAPSSRALSSRSEQAKSKYRAILRKLALGRSSDLSDEERRVLALFPKGASKKTFAAAAERIRFQLGQADKFHAGLQRMGRWEEYIRRTLRERGVPESLVALPHVESSYNPKAHSHAGASGLWQFTGGTGRMYMRLDHVMDERRDPFIATVAAARLLKANHEKTKTWPLAITSYNHGAAGMARAVRQLGTRDIGQIVDRYRSASFGFASKNFYCEFLAARAINENPEKYFGPIRKDAPENPEIVILDHHYQASTLARHLQIPIDTLRERNPALLSPVWSGQKRAPIHYGLRLPRRPDKPAGKVMLANIPGAERYAEQVVERRYRVQRGDSLSKIAHRFGVPESELVSLNGLQSRHRIRVGQVLEIPVKGGGAPSPPVTRTASATPEPVPADGLYRVRRGDNLGSIAARFGVSSQDLAATNKIRNRDSIQPGQVLEIPGGARTASPDARPVKGGVYTVRRGDTLHSIAKRMGSTEADLVALNGLKSRHRIQVGQTLYLPGSGETKEAAPEKKAEPASKPAPTAAAKAEPAPEPAPRATAKAEPAPEPAPRATAKAEPAPEPAPPEAAQAAATPAQAVPAETHELPLAPERYRVDSKGRIEVQPEETLGHYAEWLGTTASSLQGRNGLPAGRPLPLGRRVTLDFSRVGKSEFENLRLAHHRAIQQRFFAAYEVDGATDYVLRGGDTLWKLSRGEQPVPVWLLRDYNPGLDLASLREGQRVKIPKIKPRG